MTTTIEQFLASADKSVNTITAYRLDLQAWSNYLSLSEKDVTVETATVRDVIDYRHTLADSGKKPATVNRALASLKAFYAWTTEQGITPVNIAGNVKMKHVGTDNTTVKWLTPQERESLVTNLSVRSNTADIRDYAIIATMLWAGLRVSEVCDLMVSDIALDRGKSVITVNAGKGDKMRTVPVSDRLMTVLRAWMTARGQYKTSADSPYLFVSERSGHLTRSGIDSLVRERLDEVRITGHSSHSLRHTFAKSLAEQGTAIQQIARLCGHSNIQTTMIYVTPSAEELRKAVNQLR